MKSIATTLATAKFVTCVDMFKHLGVPGSNILKAGSVFTVIDPTIRRTVIVAQGALPAANKYTVPPTANIKLYCQTHRYVFVQLASSIGGESETGVYQFSFLCYSSNGTSIKVIFTNISCPEPRVTSTSITIPLELSRWSTLAIDMDQLFQNAYHSAILYKGVLQFEAMSNTVLKGVYFCTKPFTPYDAPEALFMPPPLEFGANNHKARNQSDIPSILRFYDWITVCFEKCDSNASKYAKNIYKSNISALYPKFCSQMDFIKNVRNVTRHPTGVSGEVLAKVEIDSALPNSQYNKLSTNRSSISTSTLEEESFNSRIKRTRKVQSARTSAGSVKTTIVMTPSERKIPQKRPVSAVENLRPTPASESTFSKSVPKPKIIRKPSSKPAKKQTMSGGEQKFMFADPPATELLQTHNDNDDRPICAASSQSSLVTDENNAILSISDSRLRSDRCCSVETPLTAAIYSSAVITVPKSIDKGDGPDLSYIDSAEVIKSLTVNQLEADNNKQLINDIKRKVDKGLADGFESFSNKMSSVKIIIEKIYAQQKEIIKNMNTATTSGFLMVNRVPLRYLTQMSAIEPQISIGFQTTTRFIYSVAQKSALFNPISLKNIERALLDDQCDDDLYEEAACRVLNTAFNMQLFDLVEKSEYKEVEPAPSKTSVSTGRYSKDSRPSSNPMPTHIQQAEGVTVPILEQADQLVKDLCSQQLDQDNTEYSPATVPAQKLIIRGANKSFLAGQLKRRANEGIVDPMRQHVRKTIRVAEPLSLTIQPSSGIQPVYTSSPLILCFLTANYVMALLSFYEYVISHDGSYSVSPLRAQFSLSHDYCLLCLSSMLLQDCHKNYTVALLKAGNVSLSDTSVDTDMEDMPDISTDKQHMALKKHQQKPPGLHKQRQSTGPLKYARYKQYNGDLDEQNALSSPDIRAIIDKLININAKQGGDDNIHDDKPVEVILIASAKYAPFVVVFFSHYLALFEVMSHSLCAQLKGILFYNMHSGFPTSIQAAAFSDDASKLVIAGGNNTLTSIVTAVVDLQDAIQPTHEFILLSNLAVGEQLQALLTNEPITHVLFRPGSNDQFVTLSAAHFRGWRVKYLQGLGYIKSIAIEVCNKEVQANLAHAIKKHIYAYMSENIIQPENANRRFLTILSALIKKFAKVLFTDICFSSSDRIQIATACGVILIFNYSEIIQDSSKIMLLLPSTTPDYRPLAACALSVNRAADLLSDTPIENYIIFSSVDGVVRGWINDFSTLIMQSRFKAPVIYLRDVVLSGTSRVEADTRSLQLSSCTSRNPEKCLGIAADSQLGGFSAANRSSFCDDDASKHTVIYNTAPIMKSATNVSKSQKPVLLKYGQPSCGEFQANQTHIDSHLANNIYSLKGDSIMLRQGSSLIPYQQQEASSKENLEIEDTNELLGQLSYINMLGQKSRIRQSINHTESTGSQCPSVSIDTLFFESGSDELSDKDAKNQGFSNSGFKPINSAAIKDPVLSTLRIHHSHGSSYPSLRNQTSKEARDSLNAQFSGLIKMQLRGNTQRLAFNSIGLLLPDLSTYTTKTTQQTQAPVSSGTFISVCLNGDIGLLAVGDSRGPVYNTVLCTQYKSLLDARFDPKHNEAVILTSNVINVYDLATGLRSVYFKVVNHELESSVLLNNCTSSVGKCCYHPTSYVIAVITSTLNCLLLDISTQTVIYSCNLKSSLRDASKLAAERTANKDAEMLAINTTYMQSMHIDMSMYELDLKMQEKSDLNATDSWIGETVENTTLDAYIPSSELRKSPSTPRIPLSIRLQPKESKDSYPNMNELTNNQSIPADLLSRRLPQPPRVAAESKRQAQAARQALLIKYMEMITTGRLERPTEPSHNLVFTPSGSNLLIYVDNYLFAMCTNGYAQLRLVHTNSFPIKCVVTGTCGTARRTKEILVISNIRNEVLISTIDDLLLSVRPKSLKIARHPQLICNFAYRSMSNLYAQYRIDDLVPVLRTPLLIAINGLTESLLVLIVDTIALNMPSNVTADELVLREMEKKQSRRVSVDPQYKAVYSLQSYSLNTGELQYELPFYFEADKLASYIPVHIAISQISGSVAIFFKGTYITKIVSIPLSSIAEAETEFENLLKMRASGELNDNNWRMELDISKFRHSTIGYPVHTIDHDLRTDRFLITGHDMQSATIFTWNTGEYVEFSSLAQCIEHEEGYEELVRSYLVDQKIKICRSFNDKKMSNTRSIAQTDRESIVLTINT